MKKSIISIILVLCMLFPMAAAVGVQAGDASSTAGALDNYSAADAGIDVYTAWYNTANHFTPDGNKKLDVFISAKEDRNKLPSKILVTNLKSNTSYLNAVQAWKYATFNDDTASDIFTDKEKAVYVSLLHDMIMGDDAVSGYNAIVSDTGEKIGETWENISEEGLRDFLNYLLASNLLEKYLGNKNTIEELENLLKTATDAETKQDIANAIDTVQKQNKGMATANAFLSSPVWEKIDIAANIADSALTLFDTCARLADVYALMNCDQAYFDVMKGISQSSTASDKVRAAAAEIAEVRKNYNIDRSSIMQYVFQNATKDFIIKKTTSAVYDLVLDKIKELFPAFAVWDGARAAGKFCCDFLFDTTDQNAILYSMLALDEIETALYDTTENGWTEFLMNPSVENAQFFNTAMRLIYRYHIASEQYAQQYIDSIYQGGLIPLLFSNKEDYATWTDSLTSFIKVHKIDLYLYDAWVWDTYTTYAEKLYIVYNANGGSNPPTAQMTRYEKDVALTTDIPTRTGYTFLGWSLTDNGTAQYIPGQTYAFETSVTLYAVWEKDTDSTSVPSTFDDAKAMVDFSSTAIGATKGRIRYMTQLTIDTANYVSDYWKYTVNGTTGTLSSSDKCTRCALSMTLSYLGLDYTPGYMSTLANSIDIASPWVTVPDLIPSITRVNGEFDTLFANYSASSDHSPIAVYFDYKHPNDGAIHQHAIVIIGKNGDTYYAVDSAANVTKLVELTFNADKTAIATCSYARYADTSAIKGFAQWKLNGTPDPDPNPDPDPTPESYTLSGIIRNATEGSADYGKAVEGVTVTRKASDGTVIDSTTTDANGTFSFTFTGEKGDYIFVLSKAGFQTFTTAAMTLHQTSPSLGAFVIYEEETEAEIIASGTCGDNLTWTLDDAGTLTISGEGAMTDYNSGGAPWYGKRVQIKEIVFVEGLTSIGNYAFSNCTSLTTINFAEGLTSIGYNAFSGCSALKTLRLPDTLTTIYGYAFSNCTALSEVYLGKSTTTIEVAAFANCSKLTTITLSDALTSVNWSSNYASYFSFYNAPISIVNVPSTVTYITDVFYNNISTITQFICEDSEFVNGDGYFDDDGILYIKHIYTDTQSLVKCPNSKLVKTYTVLDGTTFINHKAFQNKTSLKEVSIPDTVTSIGDYAFYSCTSLATINLAEGLTSIGDYTFSNCTSLTTINFAEGLTSIGYNAFSGCSALKTLRLPDTLTTIYGYAFSNCTALSEVYLGKSTTTIEVAAFANCSKLTTITLSDALTSVNWSSNYASYFSFYNAPISIVNVPSTVTYITDVFYNNISTITQFICEDSEFVNGDGYFDDDGILYIKHIYTDTQSLVKCPNSKLVKTYTVLDGTTFINHKAFQNKTSLKEISIPDTVTSIGDYAFYNCTNLTAAYFYGDAPTVGSSVFANASAKFTIYYIDGKSGWTTPTWNGYNTATFVPEQKTPVTGVTLSRATASLTVGDSLTLTATVSPADADDPSVTWSSSAPGVASVANGVVTAKSAGRATITVTTKDGGFTAKCVVTVTDPVTDPVATITTVPLSTKVSLGGNASYSVYISGTYDGFAFYLTAPDGMTVESVVPASPVGGSAISANHMADGRWLVSVMGNCKQTDAPDTLLATITLHVSADAAVGECTLSLEDIAVSDTKGDPVTAVKTVYGTLTVVDYVPGDVNGDGVFDYYDVTKLYACFCGKTTIANESIKDINGDGTFDYFDVAKLYAVYRGDAVMP